MIGSSLLSSRVVFLSFFSPSPTSIAAIMAIINRMTCEVWCSLLHDCALSLPVSSISCDVFHRCGRPSSNVPSYIIEKQIGFPFYEQFTLIAYDTRSRSPFSPRRCTQCNAGNSKPVHASLSLSGICSCAPSLCGMCSSSFSFHLFLYRLLLSVGSLSHATHVNLRSALIPSPNIFR